MEYAKGLPSYPKVYNLGHPVLERLFEGPVVVQEKVDGSQFSFGLTGEGLTFRSRGARIFPETTDKLFQGAVQYVQQIQGRLKEGLTYRGEVLCRPKHNTLRYDRTPNNFIILFDIDSGLEVRLTPEEVKQEGQRLGLEVVPTIESSPTTLEELEKLVREMKPILGGEQVEGVVIKNYDQYNPRDGKMLMGKLVSQDFREKHTTEWKKANPGRGDIIQTLVMELQTEARWEKAIQHLRDRGELQQAPQDIGPLIKEIKQDIIEEESDYIKERLFNAFKEDVVRGAAAGFPEWYKNKLLHLQFERSADVTSG